MIGKLKDLIRLAGGEWMITFTTRDDPRKLFDTLKEKIIRIDLKKFSPKRSRDANALCWALCSDIGKAMNPPLKKEDVYRMAIRAVGVYTDVEVKTWDVDTLIGRWSSHGEGWIADVIDDAGIGRKKVFLYYGSSTYDTQALSKLIDYLVDEAQQMEIPIPARREQEEMLKQWQAKA